MCKILTTTSIVLVFSFVVWTDNTNFKKHTSCKVFFDARKHQTNYTGPGREEVCPNNIKEVLIGYFGPGTLFDPEYGDMWSAACLAVEQANKAGGYKGLPFRLVSGWSGNPWGSGISKVVRMAYVDRVWAVIGGMDGPSTHLAEQIAVKARIAVISPVSTDKTVNLANVPWIFSCLPGDHLQAPILANSISRIGKKPFNLVSAVDHDSHLFTVELIKSLAKQQLVPAYHLEFNPNERNVEELTEKIVSSKAHALVLIADARNSAYIIRSVREKHFKGLIFGGPCMGRRRFLEQVGQTTNNLIFPLLYRPCKGPNSFEEKFTRRFGHYPDYLASHTYDAVNLLISAIHKAGLNRACICDQIRELSPWYGVTGKMHWDSLGSNLRPMELGTIRNGHVEPLSKTKSPLLTYALFSNYLR
ncbi:MAG: ABC transporter substrate-binding protein [Planctomycetota bacterium]|jgi:ABC-type branched-subunit amino acid transport system substrate-binding protein